MSVKSAAIQVLRQAGKAMHTREIAKQIKAANLCQLQGDTPGATVGSQLYRDIKNNGDKSVFVKVDTGTFALRDSNLNKAKITSPEVNQDSRSTPAGSNVSFTDCAQRVLEKFGNEELMHYTDITKKALEEGWLITKGKTPEASMLASVYAEIKLQKKRGEQPRFTQHGRGNIGLSKWEEQGLASQIEQHNQKIRDTLSSRLLKMEPNEFEGLIALLLAEMGFNQVEITTRNNDGGIDVRGTLVVGDAIRIRMAVQVKRWSKNIQAPTVQQVRGSLGAHEQGLIITTSDFSTGATSEAKQADKIPVGLMNGKNLVMLLMEHDIGVQRSTPNLFEIDDEDLTITA
ncbi:MAG: HTH domain-containing protein [Pseudohongiellaceae bacterium]